MILVLLSAASNAQVVRYATDFSDGAGWTLPPPCGDCVQWSVDATPAAVLGTPSWLSAPSSLNFNNGVCFGQAECLGSTQGTAASPPIDVSAPAGGAALSFACMWDTETEGACFFDARRVEVSNDGFASLLLEACYEDVVCGPPGFWHEHTLALEPAWGSVQVRFVFDSHDSLFNDGAGWFVDDMAVVTDCSEPASYCTAKVNSQGCTPEIGATGFASATLPAPFVIEAVFVLNNKSGVLIYGYAPDAAPFQGGTLCISPPLQRVAVPGSGGNPPPSDCSGTYAFDFNARIQSGVDAGLAPGEQVYAQYVSRDPLSRTMAGLTDGLVFAICP